MDPDAASLSLAGSEQNLMNRALRIGAALIRLLAALAFPQSVFQVAIKNRQRGDQLSRCVGWLVHSALASRPVKRQSYADIQDVLA